MRNRVVEIRRQLVRERNGARHHVEELGFDRAVRFGCPVLDPVVQRLRKLEGDGSGAHDLIILASGFGTKIRCPPC